MSNSDQELNNAIRHAEANLKKAENALKGVDEKKQKIFFKQVEDSINAMNQYHRYSGINGNKKTENSRSYFSKLFSRKPTKLYKNSGVSRNATTRRNNRYSRVAVGNLNTKREAALANNLRQNVLKQYGRSLSRVVNLYGQKSEKTFKRMNQESKNRKEREEKEEKEREERGRKEMEEKIKRRKELEEKENQERRDKEQEEFEKEVQKGEERIRKIYEEYNARKAKKVLE
jgi:hypothetical protein